MRRFAGDDPLGALEHWHATGGRTLLDHAIEKMLGGEIGPADVEGDSIYIERERGGNAGRVAR